LIVASSEGHANSISAGKAVLGASHVRVYATLGSDVALASETRVLHVAVDVTGDAHATLDEIAAVNSATNCIVAGVLLLLASPRGGVASCSVALVLGTAHHLGVDARAVGRVAAVSSAGILVVTVILDELTATMGDVANGGEARARGGAVDGFRDATSALAVAGIADVRSGASGNAASRAARNSLDAPASGWVANILLASLRGKATSRRSLGRGDTSALSASVDDALVRSWEGVVCADDGAVDACLSVAVTVLVEVGDVAGAAVARVGVAFVIGGLLAGVKVEDALV